MVVVLRLTFAPHIFNQNIILNFASKHFSPPTPSPRARMKRTLRRTQRQTGSAPRRLDRLWSASGPACGQPLWVLVWPTCGTSFGTLLGPVLAHFGDQFWPTFGSSFGSLLGPVLAHFWGQFWPTFGASFGPLLGPVLVHLWGQVWFTSGAGFGHLRWPGVVLSGPRLGHRSVIVLYCFYKVFWPNEARQVLLSRVNQTG